VAESNPEDSTALTWAISSAACQALSCAYEDAASDDPLRSRSRSASTAAWQRALISALLRSSLSCAEAVCCRITGRRAWQTSHRGDSNNAMLLAFGGMPSCNAFTFRLRASGSNCFCNHGIPSFVTRFSYSISRSQIKHGPRTCLTISRITLISCSTRKTHAVTVLARAAPAGTAGPVMRSRDRVRSLEQSARPWEFLRHPVRPETAPGRSYSRRFWPDGPPGHRSSYCGLLL